jgi:hypothetical protein
MVRPLLLALLLSVLSTTLFAQDEPEPTAPEERKRLEIGFEAKAHYRWSEELMIPSPFPFGPGQLPPGQTVEFLETVDPGSHVEVSVLSVFLDYAPSPAIAAHAKVDLIDLYDRNPTSTDKKVDVDEVWVRFGKEAEPARLPEKSGLYAKIGKMGKFERQDDRHLESYGLMATAFNRFEDTGIEVGVDLGRHFYVKGSLTQGNPVFFRDPNALAGDNGTPELLEPNPDPALGNGFPILYDAEVEDLDIDGDLETGIGVGVRFGDAAGRRGFEAMAWGYERQLAETVDLEGTFYGGDLDLLLGPANLFPLPVENDDKEDVGANVWLYWGGFTLFAQVVDQDLGGLERSGFEVETSWRFELPLKWSAGGQQLFTYIAPAVRFSQLDPEIAGHPLYPAPSVRWDWDKLDIGVRIGILSGFDLTLEWIDNTFVAGGRDRSNDEALVTLRFGRR